MRNLISLVIFNFLFSFNGKGQFIPRSLSISYQPQIVFPLHSNPEIALPSLFNSYSPSLGHVIEFEYYNQKHLLLGISMSSIDFESKKSEEITNVFLEPSSIFLNYGIKVGYILTKHLGIKRFWYGVSGNVGFSKHKFSFNKIDIISEFPIEVDNSYEEILVNYSLGVVNSYLIKPGLRIQSSLKIHFMPTQSRLYSDRCFTYATFSVGISYWLLRKKKYQYE